MDYLSNPEPDCGKKLIKKRNPHDGGFLLSSCLSDKLICISTGFRIIILRSTVLLVIRIKTLRVTILLVIGVKALRIGILLIVRIKTLRVGILLVIRIIALLIRICLLYTSRCV